MIKSVIKLTVRSAAAMMLPAMLAAGLLAGCTSIDCPLNNTVYTQYTLGGDTLTDTLTILTQRADGTDSILVNRNTPTLTLQLPMSYTAPADVLLFIRSDSTTSVTDTVTVSKTNQQHFEDVDCQLNYFHTITSVDYTRHGIDSIIITNTEVNYDASKYHFRIRFKDSLH